VSKRSAKKRHLIAKRMTMQEYNKSTAELDTRENLLLMKKAEAEMKLADLTGSAEGLATVPAWKRDQLARKQAVRERLMKNGITEQDLTDAYERGRKDATKEYVDKLLPFQQKFFYSAAAIAAHDLFGFGKDRGLRLLERIQEIMCEEISTGDIIDRCKRETGVDCFEEEFTI